MRRQEMNVHLEESPPGAAAISDADISTILQSLIEKVAEHVQQKASIDKADLSGLVAVDKHLAILELSIISLEQRVHLHTSEQRQKRNRAVLVNRLHTELLVQIFSIAVDDDDVAAGGQVDRLDDLALVCHQWNDLVKGSPSLRTIICSNKPDQLRRSLARSLHSPLDVRCYGLPDMRWRKDVEKHRTRWRSFSLRSGRLGALRWFVETSAPSLQGLDIQLYHTDAQKDHHELKIQDEVIGRLSRLSLGGSSITWNPSFLSSLETLHLERLGETNRISTQQLIVVLRSLHGLADLLLGEGAVNDSSQYEDTTPVELPLLTRLTLEIRPRAAHYILTVLRIPICTNLRIMSADPTDIEVLDACTTHISTVVRSILARLDHVGLILRPEFIKIFQRRPSRINNVTLDVTLSYNVPQLVRWLDTVLVSLRDQASIHLSVEGPFSLDRTWPSFFLNAHVDQIVLCIVDAYLKEWLLYLSQPVLVDNTLMWPLPHVHSMYFGFCEPLDSWELLRMMQSRYGPRRGVEERVSGQGAFDPATSAGHTKESSVEGQPLEMEMDSTNHVSPVASLRVLEIYGEMRSTEEDIEKLEAMVGEKFIWPGVKRATLS
ncbi:hypothetical protein FRB97_001280 [Tulasnella sp. 331]|nr:hypothetical protein FRB97_001280 [Tulasnella sp. 331]